MQTILPMNKADGQPALPGWRLQRLEILNWGTFDAKINTLVMDGQWTILAGANGTGKSTAVDALRTLLVPLRSASFNDAASDHKHAKERNLKSYILGAYTSERQDHTVQGKVKYLREPGSTAILLAVFGHDYSQAKISLAQIFTDVSQSAPDIRRLIATKELSIKTDLVELIGAKPKDFTKKGMQVYTPTAYGNELRKLLGIPGEAALLAFNNAIGIKEVVDLSPFIRDYLLEPSQINDFIVNTLKPAFENLSICWAKIKDAEDKIKALTPMVTDCTKLLALEASLTQLDRLKEVLPIYFAQQDVALCSARKEQIAEEIKQLLEKLQVLNLQQEEDEKQRDATNAALHSDRIHVKIDELVRQIEAQQRQKTECEKEQKTFKARLASIGNYTPPASQNDLDTLQDQLREVLPKIKECLEAKEKEKTAREIEHHHATEQLEEWIAERNNAEANKALIPMSKTAARERICAGLGLDPQQLPFAGELIEVKPQYAEWANSIEKLLFNFATSLVINDDLYDRVSTFIDETDMRTQINFYQVQNLREAVDIPSDAKRVVARLDFREKHVAVNWVKAEIVRSFRHICCDNSKELRQYEYAITKAGILRYGHRHTKDDRKEYKITRVLGWNPEAKIKSLTNEIVDLTLTREIIAKGIAKLKVELANEKHKIDNLMALLELDNYSLINSDPAIAQIITLTKEKEQLEQSSETHKQLQQQLQQTQERLKTRNADIQATIAQQAVLNKEVKDLEDRIGERLQTTNYHLVIAQPDILELLALDSRNPTLGSLRQIEANTTTRLQKQWDEADSKKQDLSGKLLPAMQDFVRIHTNEAGLKAEISYTNEFAKLLTTLQSERLPEYKTQFAEFQNHSMINQVVCLKQTLYSDVKNNKLKLDEVNKTLKTIDFLNNTYVQVVEHATRNSQIAELIQMLTACIENQMNDANATSTTTYEAIRTLLTKLEKDGEWAKTVLDVRNWKEYAVQSYSKSTGNAAEYFDSSDGKSGGEKSLIASIILAAAITLQYGLTGAQDDLDKFRLVVVDEMFSKTDETNSRLALELFKRLDLQLLIVSPFDAKTQLAEEYVGSFHLAHKKDNLSYLQRASKAEYNAVIARSKSC